MCEGSTFVEEMGGRWMFGEGNGEEKFGGGRETKGCGEAGGAKMAT